MSKYYCEGCKREVGGDNKISLLEILLGLTIIGIPIIMLNHVSKRHTCHICGLTVKIVRSKFEKAFWKFVLWGLAGIIAFGILIGIVSRIFA